MSKKILELIINKYSTKPINYITNGDFLYYRNHLEKFMLQNIVPEQPINQDSTTSLKIK